MPSFSATTGGSEALPGDVSAGSVGVVAPALARFDTPLPLASGRALAGYELAYETYGTLNADALATRSWSATRSTRRTTSPAYYADDPDNVGWWDNMIGPGKPLDTDRFFVVGVNNLGSCFGSTGPAVDQSRDRASRGARDFPLVTVEDWVDSQARLADRLGIAQFAAVMGGSLGGDAGAGVGDRAIRQRIRHALVIAAAPNLSAQNIAFNEVARQAIMTDPDFHGGHFDAHGAMPRRGPARRAHGRPHHLPVRRRRWRRSSAGSCATASQLLLRTEFQIESYLRYQGEKFAEYFDANTYLRITKALDYFDPASAHGGDLARALAPARCEFLVVVVHDRLALSRRALARDREGAGRQPARRDLRGDRRAARPRCVPARQPAVSRGWCARTSTASRPHRPATVDVAASARRSVANGNGDATTPRRATRCHRADFATIAELDRARRAACSTWAAATAALLAYLRARAQRQRLRRRDRRRGRARQRAERRQRDPERPRARPRRLRRRLVRLRDPVADAAGDAPHRGDRRARCCASGARRSSRSPTSATGAPAADPARPHAGVRSAAVPVVRHAEHPPVHRRRLRRVPRGARASRARSRRAGGRTARRMSRRTCSASSRSTAFAAADVVSAFAAADTRPAQPRAARTGHGATAAPPAAATRADSAGARRAARRHRCMCRRA